MRKQNGIHKHHCFRQHNAILQHWKPFFENRLLGDITRSDLDKFADHLGAMTRSHTDGTVTAFSASEKNRIIKAGTKALRWAYDKELIEKDITKGLMLYTGKPKERIILTPELATALFKTEWENATAKLANMLASCTGMRQGEILALQVRDIGKDIIYVKHGYNYIEGIKSTKNNKPRDII